HSAQGMADERRGGAYAEPRQPRQYIARIANRELVALGEQRHRDPERHVDHRSETAGQPGEVVLDPQEDRARPLGDRNDRPIGIGEPAGNHRRKQERAQDGESGDHRADEPPACRNGRQALERNIAHGPCPAPSRPASRSMTAFGMTSPSTAPVSSTTAKGCFFATIADAKLAILASGRTVPPCPPSPGCRIRLFADMTLARFTSRVNSAT